MKAHLQSILAKIPAEYSQARFEKIRETRIDSQSRISSTETSIVIIRILSGKRQIEVRMPAEMEAEKCEKIVLKHIAALRNDETPEIPTSLPMRMESNLNCEILPSARSLCNISTEEKLAAHADYERSLAELSRDFQLGYFETIRERCIVDSLGNHISEPLGFSRFSCRWTGQHQTGHAISFAEGVGSSDDFDKLIGRQSDFFEGFQTWQGAKTAASVTPGTMPVLFDGFAAGMFYHECLGHNFESDYPWARYLSGDRVAHESISISSIAATPDVQGSYVFDDEGTRARNVRMVSHGIAEGFLHSSKTAAREGCTATGHVLAGGADAQQMIRMGTIRVEPGEDSLEKLLEKVGNGLLICGCGPGRNSGDSFGLTGTHGFRIQDGRIAEQVLTPRVQGFFADSISGVLGVGNELALTDSIACSKGRVPNFRSQLVAPAVAVQSLRVS